MYSIFSQKNFINLRLSIFFLVKNDRCKSKKEPSYFRIKRAKREKLRLRKNEEDKMKRKRFSRGGREYGKEKCERR